MQTSSMRICAILGSVEVRCVCVWFSVVCVSVCASFGGVSCPSVLVFSAIRHTVGSGQAHVFQHH